MAVPEIRGFDFAIEIHKTIKRLLNLTLNRIPIPVAMQSMCSHLYLNRFLT